MNIVIGVYPPWAAGKFLFNCLGLSDQCYLQDIDLVKLQLNNKLNPTDKFNLLTERLNAVGDSWDDLELGCHQLFGNKFNAVKFYPEINTLAQQDKLFFAVAHNPDILEKLMKIWPTASVIYFNNNNKFLDWRLGNTTSQYTDLHFHLHTDKINQFRPTNKFFYWDSDVYLDKIEFMKNIQTLYTDLGLTDFNSDFISKFYDNYIAVITRLRP